MKGGAPGPSSGVLVKGWLVPSSCGVWRGTEVVPCLPNYTCSTPSPSTTSSHHFSAPRKLVEKSNQPTYPTPRPPPFPDVLLCSGRVAARELGMPTMSLSDGIGMGAILNIRRIPTLSPQLHSIAATHFLRPAQLYLHFCPKSASLHFCQSISPICCILRFCTLTVCGKGSER